MRLKIQTCQKVIVACAILHNIAIFHDDDNFPEVPYDHRVLEGHAPIPPVPGGRAYRAAIIATFEQ
jgi:hypothetical protein